MISTSLSWSLAAVRSVSFPSLTSIFDELKKFVELRNKLIFWYLSFTASIRKVNWKIMKILCSIDINIVIKKYKLSWYKSFPLPINLVMQSETDVITMNMIVGIKTILLCLVKFTAALILSSSSSTSTSKFTIAEKCFFEKKVHQLASVETNKKLKTNHSMMPSYVSDEGTLTCFQKLSFCLINLIANTKL